ncbi:MAG: DUF2142 domain-containing protein [Candidatus Dormibacteraeota bacterium]|nr:DUF2142 domain-containing protein [Candidatus Dormibacteraeota bacterium]
MRPRWLPVALVVVAAAATSVAYAHLTPVGYGPDEPLHWNYIQVLLHGALPGATVSERQQPPLYYLFGAAVASLGGALTTVRLVSAVLGAATALLAALAAREIWPSSPLRWALVAAPSALLPQLQWLDGTVSNDALSFASAAALVLATVLTFTRRPSARTLAVAGFAVAAALLSKETDYGLIVVLLLCVAIRWRSALMSWAGMALIAPPLLLAGWWFARNLGTFGSPLPPLHPLLTSPVRLRTLGQARAWTGTAVVSMVGSFPTFDAVRGGTAATWRTVLNLLDVLVLAVVALTAALGWVAARTWDGGRRGLAVAMAGSVAVSLLLMVANSVFIDYQPQGRYVLVAGPAIAILCIGGGAHLLSRVPPVARRGLAASALLAVVLVDVVAFETMRQLAARVG